jgi:mannose-6-phosphate isomerase-like protein (cupin superfamily)
MAARCDDPHGDLRAQWRGSAERVTVRAGQSLLIPAGRKHGFRNSGTATLHVHAVLAAPVFEALPEGATEATRRWEQ